MNPYWTQNSNPLGSRIVVFLVSFIKDDVCNVFNVVEGDILYKLLKSKRCDGQVLKDVNKY